MGCKKYQKSLIDYVNGTLDAQTRERVEAHLESCAECAAVAARLELSSKALVSLTRPSLSEQASSRMLSAIHSGKVPVPRSSFFHSPRPAMAAGALALVALIAVFVVIGIGNNNRQSQKTASNLGMKFQANDGGSIPVSLESGTQLATSPPSATGMLASISPIVKTSQSDYNKDTLKNTFEALPERKKFATQYTMADAVRLSGNYSQQCCQRYASLGEDPALLESIINSVMVSEPVEIPYYVEKARYTGRTVVIIAFVAPRKGGTSMNLIRNDVWVWDPALFTSNPNNSLVYMFQENYEP
jgi:Putative zinc-finger